MSYARIRPRRGTAYEWATVNPILESGELAVEIPDTGLGTGFCKFKLGSGVDSWNELEYAFDGTTASAINGGTIETFHLIQLRAGTSTLWEDINPIINENEIVFVTDKRGFKVGDGESHFNDLEYTTSGSMVDDMFDFGDEEENDVIYSSPIQAREAHVEEYNYPESVYDIPVEKKAPVGGDTEGDLGSIDTVSAPAPVEKEASLEDLLKVDPEDKK